MKINKNIFLKIDNSEKMFGKFLIFVLGVIMITSCGVSDEPDNQLKLSDFKFLVYGMSYDEITEKVGSADAEVGSGLFIYVYKLGESRELYLSFGGNPEDLLSVSIRITDNTFEEIVLPIQ